MDDNALDRLVRAAQAERAEDEGPHPQPDELWRYRAGQMTPAEAERLQDHLVACVECARLVADLDAFPRLDPLGEADVPDAEEVEAGWDRVARALESVPVAPARADADAAPTSVGREERRVSGDRDAPAVRATGNGLRRHRPTWQVAAVLAMAAGGLGYVGSRWLNGPAITPGLPVSLLAEDDTTRSGAGAHESEPLAAAETHVLQLINSHELSGQCGIDILSLRASKESLVRTLARYHESAEDSLTLVVWGGTLAPGSYRVRATCSRGAPASYIFSVVP